MKRRLSLHLVFLLTALALVGCGTIKVTPRVLFLTDSHHGKTQNIIRGGLINIDLQGDPETGLWQLQSPLPATLVQESEPRVRRYTDALGSAGITSFQYRAQKTGSATLSLAFKHPQSGATLRTWTVTVDIRELENTR